MNGNFRGALLDWLLRDLTRLEEHKSYTKFDIIRFAINLAFFLYLVWEH